MVFFQVHGDAGARPWGKERSFSGHHLVESITRAMPSRGVMIVAGFSSRRSEIRSSRSARRISFEISSALICAIESVVNPGFCCHFQP